MSVFTVRQHGSGRVLFETDDGLDAEVFVHEWGEQHRVTNANYYYTAAFIEGTDPSHDWQQRDGATRCARCDAWANGSFGSHLPCGFEAERPLIYYIKERQAQ